MMVTQHVHINVGGKSREERAQIEAKRGIVRDNGGKIIRSEEWVRNRISLLQDKRETYLQRINTINEELAALGVGEVEKNKTFWDRFLEFVKEIFN